MNTKKLIVSLIVALMSVLSLVLNLSSISPNYLSLAFSILGIIAAFSHFKGYRIGTIIIRVWFFAQFLTMFVFYKNTGVSERIYDVSQGIRFKFDISLVYGERVVLIGVNVLAFLLYLIVEKFLMKSPTKPQNS